MVSLSNASANYANSVAFRSGCQPQNPATDQSSSYRKKGINAQLHNLYGVYIVKHVHRTSASFRHFTTLEPDRSPFPQQVGPRSVSIAITAEMQGIVRRRIEVVGNHFNVHQRLPQQHSSSEGITFDAEQLQKLLEHDNWETRAKLKELTKQDIFIP